MAVKFDIPADKRTPFVDSIVMVGPNWSSAAFLLHIRNNPGDTGTPLVDLSNAAAGLQGISATYNAAYSYEYEGVATISPATIITVQIDEANIEALSLGTPYDKDLALHYDLHVTPSGGIKKREIYGLFIISPGVTI
jgi:hypothetical protein